MRYAQKVFGLSALLKEFDSVRAFKQTNDAASLFGIISGLTMGLTSLNELAKHTEVSRSVLESLLNLDGLRRRMRRFIASMIKRLKRGKMIRLENVRGKFIAAVDGIETFRRQLKPEDFYALVQQGLVGEHCQVGIHRNRETGAIEYFEIYHRIVIISMITDRGPMPLGWRYQASTAGQAVLQWLQSSRAGAFPLDAGPEKIAKQDGELTALKQLLTELREMFSGKLPFDILIGDGLYDKAPILECVESYGVALIAVQKDERRKARDAAEMDFSTRPADREWAEISRSFQGWSGVYEDENIGRRNKTIKIVRVIRQNSDGAIIDNYFYCTNKPWITARLVEWCRYYRWREENGFNAWTNLWGLLKHVFHHTANACDTMMGLIFAAIIVVENYRFGNLRRGSRKSKSTLREFFRDLFAAYKTIAPDEYRNFYFRESAENTS